MYKSALRCTAPVSLFSLLFFFTAAAADVSAQGGMRWVRGGSSVPSNAVVGGKDSNGSTLFICRTTHRGTTLPGKVVAGKCNYNWGTTEYSSGSFEILVGTGGYWTRDINPRSALVGGSGGNQTYYVCRAFASGGSHPGRMQDGKCNYGYAGRGYAATNYEVLNGGAAAAVSLLDAALRGDAREVRTALRAGEAINQKNAKGQTALMLAASKGSVDVVRVLLNEGATVDARDNEGFTALGYAAFAGDVQAVRQLLRAGANVSSRTNNGNMPLYFAAASGDIETVRAIMSESGRRDGPVAGFPLHGAAAYDRTNVIAMLLDDEVVDVDEQDANGQTALMVAARNNKAGAVTSLLGYGADVTIRTPNNHDVASLAAYYNAREVLGVLLGSDKFSIRSRAIEGAFRVAARESKLPALNYLLQRGVNVDATLPNVGMTALMLAAGEGHDDVVKALLSARASVDLQNAKGETALILGAAAGKKDVVKLLVRAGADRSLTDGSGRTALQYAIQNKHGDTRKELERGGN